LRLPKSEEDKRFESLFMNEGKADAIFKVQGEQFPVCKEVVNKKAKYLAQQVLTSN